MDEGEFHDALGARDGEITKEKSIDQREDGDIRANAQRERGNSDGTEARILAEGAQGAAKFFQSGRMIVPCQGLRQVKGRFQEETGQTKNAGGERGVSKRMRSSEDTVLTPAITSNFGEPREKSAGKHPHSKPPVRDFPGCRAPRR